jgi:hypothetical protein
MPEERPRSSYTRVRARRMTRSGFYTLGYLFLLLRDSLIDDFWRIWDNFRLFLGSSLLLVGLLSIESARYCDGSPEDTFACTRPSTYYYFDALDITLIILGTILILLWVVSLWERGEA